MPRSLKPATRPAPFRQSAPTPLLSAPLLWPVLAAAAASDAFAAYFHELADGLGNHPETLQAPEPEWTTPNHIRLELPTMRLRCFCDGANRSPTLVCAPFALHGATITDFAPEHSVIDGLRRAGVDRLYVTDWRSATAEMQLLSIDNYLAELNVAVEELGPPVNLIGLCQGGWMSLVYAARFPGKVRRLVLAGAPIDLEAGDSEFSRRVERVPLSVFEDFVRLGGGRVLGQRVLEQWSPTLAPEDAGRILQLEATDGNRRRELEERFMHWYGWTLDLPGVFFLQVTASVFKQNQIARNEFIALGRRVDLKQVRNPLFLLSARDDEIVAPAQLLATARLVGTPEDAIETETAPGTHLSLFLGGQTVARTWPKMAHWLQ
jgi:poly(3-hydroxyalkanoate) synthetase